MSARSLLFQKRWLVAGAFGLIGCGALAPPPRATFKPTARESTFAAVDAAQVQVFDADAPLPDGITRKGNEVFADPATPSPAAPHRVIGQVKVPRNKHHDRQAYLSVMQAEAAKHGAKALVLVDEKGERCLDENHHCRLGFAVFLSDAAKATFPTAKASLEAWVAAHPAIGQPDASPREIDLATTTRFDVTPRRGECLTFVLALGEDARVTRAHDRAALRLQTTTAGVNRSENSPDDWGATDRVLALDAGCAQSAARVDFVVRHVFEDAKDPPGTGRAIVQVFRRTVDEATLKQQAKSFEEADRRGAALRATMQQEACEKCYENWRNCLRADPAIEKGQCARFNNCVDRSGYKASACIMH